ncbi:MAG: hypothetical protein ACK5XS_10170 [Armatimonadota bacterium]|nr:hypothetical protein [Fimbriimonadaceae bacterium]
MTDDQFTSAVASCIRRMSVLKGGPTSPEAARDWVDAYRRALEPMRKERYPLEPRELVAAVNGFLARSEPWFPTPGEFLGKIEARRSREFVTVSRVLDDGGGTGPGIITFIKCPPDRVEDARRELMAKVPDALPAPERTATAQQIEKLRSLKVFGAPQVEREVS